MQKEKVWHRVAVILLSVLINDLLKEAEKAEPGIQVESEKIGG